MHYVEVIFVMHHQILRGKLMMSFASISLPLSVFSFLRSSHTVLRLGTMRGCVTFALAQ